MQSRWTLTIGISMALLGVLLVWFSRQPIVTGGAEAPSLSPSPPVAAAEAAPPAPAAATPAQSAAVAAVSAPALDSSVGTVTSAIHFERASTQTRIDVSPQFAVGSWKPDQRRLRVLLLESAPKPGTSAALISALQSSDAPPVTPAALIDLRFIPSAQAFDRSEVDTGTLTAVNAQGESSTADILGSLEWHGSLPAFSADGSPITVKLQMSSSGNGATSDREPWKQSWQFNLAVPITLIP